MNAIGIALALVLAGPITTRQALTTGTPANVPGTAGNGTSDSFARVDHVHGCTAASATTTGCLSSANWTTFNGKAATGSCAEGSFVDSVSSSSGPGCSEVRASYVTSWPKCSAGEFLTAASDVLSCDSMSVALGDVSGWPTCGAGTFLKSSGAAPTCVAQSTVATDVVCNECIADSDVFSVTGAKIDGAVALASQAYNLSTDPEPCPADQFVYDMDSGGVLSCALATPPIATATTVGGLKGDGSDTRCAVGAHMMGWDDGTGTILCQLDPPSMSVPDCGTAEVVTGNGLNLYCVDNVAYSAHAESAGVFDHNPTGCAAGTAATDIDSGGNLGCSAVAPFTRAHIKLASLGPNAFNAAITDDCTNAATNLNTTFKTYGHPLVVTMTGYSQATLLVRVKEGAAQTGTISVQVYDQTAGAVLVGPVTSTSATCSTVSTTATGLSITGQRILQCQVKTDNATDDPVFGSCVVELSP